MSDITLCQNKDCTKRHSCKRQTTNPSKFGQSYTIFYPASNGKCEAFIEDKNTYITADLHKSYTY